MSSGRLLLFCDWSGSGMARDTALLDVRTGRSVILPRQPGAGQQALYSAMGDQWVQSWSGDRYRNWRTGKVLGRRPFDSDGTTRIYNLDKTGLPLVRCGSLARFFTQSQRFYWQDDLVGHPSGDTSSPLVLAHHCSRRTVLDAKGGDAFFSAGVVSWSHIDGTVRAFRLSDRRTFTWRVHVDRRFSEPLIVENTAGRIFVARTLTEAGTETAFPTSFAIYEARIGR